MKTLEYVWSNGTHMIFEKYNIDMQGDIFNKKTGKRKSHIIDHI